MNLMRVLQVLVGVEAAVCAVLFGLRLNATLPTPPPVGDYTDAITGADLLAAPDRFLFDSAKKWRTLGETYMQSRFFSKGEACLHAAADRDPKSADTALWHGCCLEQLGELEAARAAYLRSAQYGSSRTAELAWYRVGRIHLQLEQGAEATRAFEKAGDDHLPSVYQRAKLLVRGGSAAEAVPLLERLVEDQPRDLHVWQLRARAAEALGNAEEAAAARDIVLRSVHLLHLEEPRMAMLPLAEPFGMYQQIVETMKLRRKGQVDLAAEKLLQIVGDETHWENKFPSLLEVVAEVLLEARNLAMARTLLEQQIEARGAPSKQAWELLAQVEFAENELDPAWDDWCRAERLRPHDVDHEKMAQLAEKRGDSAAARRQRGLARQYAGLSKFLNDRLEDARTSFREAVKVDAELPDAWFHLGETERLLGAPAAAKTAFERCLELMPNHGRARDQLRRLINGK
jgi:tetratricopeptide (TPR) repeat protein